jgi:hypothetical protein
MKNNILFKTTFWVLFLLLCTADLDAQCAMCKAAAESNMKNGGTDPQGLNLGILYMLMLPYLTVGAIGYWWWRNRRKDADAPKYTEDELSRLN